MGSFSPGDACRHPMYQSIWDELFKMDWERTVYRVMEIGTWRADTPILSMLTTIANVRNFGLNIELADYCTGNHDDLQTLRFPDSSYDIFIADQVLEHVPKVWKAAEEVCRVVKPGGLAIMTTPFLYPLHDYPVDCWRITPHGYQVLFPDEKWNTVAVHATGTKQMLTWAYNHANGFLDTPMTVEKARAEIPDYDKPVETPYAAMVYWIGRKK